MHGLLPDLWSYRGLLPDATFMDFYPMHFWDMIYWRRSFNFQFVVTTLGDDYYLWLVIIFTLGCCSQWKIFIWPGDYFAMAFFNLIRQFWCRRVDWVRGCEGGAWEYQQSWSRRMAEVTGDCGKEEWRNHRYSKGFCSYVDMHVCTELEFSTRENSCMWRFS